MFILEDKSKCSGCHACYSVCPQRCITMQPDSEGFLQPKIDEMLCVSCGLCKRVCPVLNSQRGKRGEAYACINKNESVRMQSSSGGVFSLLAEAVIGNGGVVFGAGYDESFQVEHIEIDSAENLHRLRGSKYVQSRIGDAYRRAKRHLDNGQTVLFSGTPCQISALTLFLGKEYENLYTQDIVCHGVPSPSVWQAYVAYREKKQGSKIRDAFFRNKDTGWKSFSMAFDFADGSTYRRGLHQDAYMKGFLANLFLRNSCYACTSKALERVSDITLADFWGAEKLLPDLDDNKGLSLVIVNSEKGKRLLAEVSDRMNMQGIDLDTAIQYNSAAYRSVEKPKKREAFFALLHQKAFDKVVEGCIPRRSVRKYIGKAKRWIKRMCKKNV